MYEYVYVCLCAVVAKSLFSVLGGFVVLSSSVFYIFIPVVWGAHEFHDSPKERKKMLLSHLKVIRKIFESSGIVIPEIPQEHGYRCVCHVNVEWNIMMECGILDILLWMECQECLDCLAACKKLGLDSLAGARLSFQRWTVNG